jgi:predicted nucleotidyltransferase
VAERTIFTDREAGFLRSLVENEVDFMIVGLSAAILQGAPAVTQDIELWVRDVQDAGFLRALKEAGAAYVPQIGLNPPMLAGESVRLFDLVSQMSGLGSFEEEVKDSVRIDVGGVAVLVLSLERIIASKEAANREKDRLVLPVLRDAAITLRELRESRKKP